MEWLFPSVVASFIGTLVLTAIYFYLYKYDRQKFLLVWSIGWLIYAIRFIFMLLIIVGVFKEHKILLVIANQLCALFSGIILLQGTFLFSGKDTPKQWYFLTILSALWIVASNYLKLPFLWQTLPTFLFIGIIYVWTGIVFLRTQPTSAGGIKITGWGFIIWGIHKIDYPLLRPVVWFAPWGYLLGATMEIIVAFGMLLLYINKSKEELKISERKLSESEAHLRTLVETIPDLIWLKDPDGFYLSCNLKFESFFGAKQSEIVGKTDYDFVNKKLADFSRKNDKAAMASGKPTVNEEKVTYASDGHQEYLETIKTPMVRKDGKLIGVLGVARDITDRKKSEREIKESHERLLAILNSLESIVYVADLDTYEVLYANNYFTEKFGEVMGKTCWKVMQAGRTGPCEFCTNDKLLDADGNPTGTYAWEFKNTIKNRWYYIHDRAIKWVDGRYVRMEIATDITEKKNAEEEKFNLQNRLQQAQKMEAIGTLAGGIAHDFNNILSVILGYTDLAKEDAPPGEEYQKDLDAVLTAANRAKDLVKQILAFSRQSQTERIPINITPLIKEGLKMLRSSIPTTISIIEDIDPQIGVIMGDPTQIHQILMNLCTNAYHAMGDPGGTLSVTLKTTVVTSDDQKMLLHVTPGEYVELVVSDTGVGIGPYIIDKIFDPYFTTKGIDKGTGMGLAIIHGIMADCGGAITVESQLGKGSTFHTYFPIIEKDAVPVIKETEEVPQGKERILFVDDEEILAEMGKSVLERLGYHVTTRRSSLEALSTFQNTPDEFDMVITDQTMPDMTGSDLARRLMQIRPDIPIILCTGYSNLIDEDSAKGLGIKEFALKPLTKDVIAKLIRKVLDAS